MRQHHNSKQRKTRSPQTTILFTFLVPLLTLGSWYALTLATYHSLPHLLPQGSNQSDQHYAILVGLLYSSLAFSIILCLGYWLALLLNKNLLKSSWKLFLLSCLVAYPIFNGSFEKASAEANKLPKTIAHRAIDNGNAPENTIEALQLTSKENPDLLEIDIYETADSNFVVFHDGNLSAKANSKKTPHDLTLAELTSMTMLDPLSLKKGKIASFDAMIEEAEKQNQRLLIDFKTSNQDSKEMVDNFMAKYQSRIESHHHQVQSANAELMKKILNCNPKFETFLITGELPKEKIPNLTGYSVPLDRLNDDFDAYLTENNFKIYAWTINDSEGVTKAEHLEVDAIITDYLDKTRQDLSAIKRFRDYRSLVRDRLNKLSVFQIN